MVYYKYVLNIICIILLYTVKSIYVKYFSIKWHKKELNYKKVNKSLYNKISCRKYSTNNCIGNSIVISDRLHEIIKELGLNPVYTKI
jgi:hypothetical protein